MPTPRKIASSSSARASSMRSFLVRLLPLVCVFLLTSSTARCLQLIAAFNSSRSTQDRRAATRAITGQVLGDGAPLQNVQVSVGAIRTAPSAYRSAMTDADGKFRIDDLEPSVYTIRVSAPGFVISPGAVEESAEELYYRPGESVTFRMTKGGVISGTVTTPDGAPLVAAGVRALKISRVTENDKWVAIRTVAGETDDRGAYRIFGLEPGSYVVSVGGLAAGFPAYYPDEQEQPTYYPSSAFETASVIEVGDGEEVSGIDITHRGEPGRRISGRIRGMAKTAGGYVFLKLSHALTGIAESSGSVNLQGDIATFAIDGVPDGDYYLSVEGSLGGKERDAVAAAPKHLAVRGSDVSGVELTVEHLGSISGKVVLQTGRDGQCGSRRKSFVSEAAIIARGKREKSQNDLPLSMKIFGKAVAPDDNGEFVLNGLFPGLYQLRASLPDELWYVQSITFTNNGGRVMSDGRVPVSDVACDGFVVRSGQQTGRIVLTLRDDGAILAGRIATATMKQMRVCLVRNPPDNDGGWSLDLETLSSPDGSFAFRNIRPGRYWILTKPIGGEKPADVRLGTEVEKKQLREELNREAQKANVVVDLKSCQHIKDYLLRPSVPLTEGQAPP